MKDAYELCPYDTQTYKCTDCGDDILALRDRAKGLCPKCKQERLDYITGVRVRVSHRRSYK
jgi:Zn finger protein HypA/HybF involved in hydrogenase expression